MTIADRLSKVHPVAYLMIYLLCIPSFAVFYILLPGEFYAPYAKLESAAESDLARLSKYLESAFQKLADQQHSLHVPVPEGSSPTVIRGVSVRSAGSLDGSQLDVHFTFWLENRRDGAVSQSSPLMHLYLVIRSDEHAESREGWIWNTRRDATRKGEYDEAYDKWDIHELVFPYEEYTVIGGYLAGTKGDPAGLSGHWVRMAYFSAIVITTVGFGDIVPMTNIARGLVGLEAICGVMIAGLFLNAVAYRASGKT